MAEKRNINIETDERGIIEHGSPPSSQDDHEDLHQLNSLLHEGGRDMQREMQES